jgi:hypothetical protein
MERRDPTANEALGRIMREQARLGPRTSCATLEEQAARRLYARLCRKAPVMAVERRNG